MTVRRFRIIDEDTGEAVAYLAQFETAEQRERAITAAEQAVPQLPAVEHHPRPGRPPFDPAVIERAVEALGGELETCRSRSESVKRVRQYLATVCAPAEIPSASTVDRWFRQNPSVKTAPARGCAHAEQNPSDLERPRQRVGISRRRAQ